VPYADLAMSTSGACTGVLISVRLPVKGWDNELEEKEGREKQWQKYLALTWEPPTR